MTVALQPLRQQYNLSQFAFAGADIEDPRPPAGGSPLIVWQPGARKVGFTSANLTLTRLKFSLWGKSSAHSKVELPAERALHIDHLFACMQRPVCLA
jgi:hypothetical protein